jgi:hypothetical protein
MSGFKAIFVPLIFLLPWIGMPAGVYFGKIKNLNKEWTTKLGERDTSRGQYGSSPSYKGRWPQEGQAETKKTKGGGEDKKQDGEAKAKTIVAKKKELEVATREKTTHRVLFDKVVNRYMAGINRERFTYEKPDEFVLELLKQQRDQAGAHLIKFLDRNYLNLYFRFPIQVPAPNININSPAALPQLGPHQRLPWPVGTGPMTMTIYGRYDDLLNFIETFPDRYDRTAFISSFALQRLAFDYRGSVLLQLTCQIEYFVWPDKAPGSPGGPPPAAGAPAAGGTPGGPGGPEPGAGSPPPPPPPSKGGGGAPKGGKGKKGGGDEDGGGGGGGGLKSRKNADGGE